MVIKNSGQQLLNETQINSSLEVFLDFFHDYIRWWYIQMPIWHLRAISRIFLVLDDNLSITLLINNFFLPWHRDRNIMGYTVGILSKLIYLPLACGIILIATVTYLFFILFWLLLPPGTIIFIIRSFFV